MQTRKETGWMRQRSSVCEEQLKLCHWTKKINNILNIFTFFGTCSMDREMEALVTRVVEVFLTFEPGANICNFRSLWNDYSFFRPFCWFKLTSGTRNLKEPVEGNKISFQSMFLSCVFLHSKYAACLEWSKILRGDKSPAWAADLSLPTYSYLFFISSTNFVDFVL